MGLNTKNQHKGDPIIVAPNPLAEIKTLRQKLWKMTVEKYGIDL